MEQLRLFPPKTGPLLVAALVGRKVIRRIFRARPRMAAAVQERETTGNPWVLHTGGEMKAFRGILKSSKPGNRRPVRSHATPLFNYTQGPNGNWRKTAVMCGKQSGDGFSARSLWRHSCKICVWANTDARAQACTESLATPPKERGSGAESSGTRSPKRGRTTPSGLTTEGSGAGRKGSGCMDGRSGKAM